MTTLYMFDAAYAPSLAKVRAAGGVAMNGYLTGIYAGTTSQPAAVRAAGLGYVPTYEEGPAELVHASRATGQAVGRKILAAFKAKGIPLDGTVAVYPSVDVNVAVDGTDHDADACNTAWLGMRDVLAGKVSLRAYAEGAVIDALASAGLVDGKCWLAAPTSWPGFNVNDAHICMVQLVGSDVPGTDKNHVITDPHALGAWWPSGSPYATEVFRLDAATKKELQAMLDAQSTELVHRFLDDSTGHPHMVATYIGEVVAAVAHVQASADTIAKVLGESGTGVGPRVAQLQAAVDNLSKSVAALAPAAEVKVDTKAVVDGVNAELVKLPAAVADEVRGMAWKVAQ